MMSNSTPQTQPAYQHQINKTLRFALTLNQIAIEKKKKNTSHNQLQDLIQKSFEKISQQYSSEKIQWDEQQFIDNISESFQCIQKFQEQWRNIYNRHDQIAVTKEFYRSLTKKARFDGFWKNNKGVKQPQSQIIKFSALNHKHNDVTLHLYITGYWQDNINRQLLLSQKFETLLTQYQQALKTPSQNHTKPNLNNFSKLFCSLMNLVNEVLYPISNSSILFPNILRNQPKDSHIQDFDSENWSQLNQKLKVIQKYLKQNGGYIPYGRVTLNQYTAKQKPHDYSKDIERLVDELQLKELILQFKGKTTAEISQHFTDLDKSKTFKDNKVSKVIKAQCFKYKPIPIIVKIHLTEYLAKKTKEDIQQVSTILDSIGQSQSPANDYKNSTKLQKEAFNLNNYPIKVAFDYAWESLAKAQCNNGIDFPKQPCKEYLKDIYDIANIEDNHHFQLYAKLLYIADNLATLEHNNPSDTQKHIENIRRCIPVIINSIEGESTKKPKDSRIKNLNNILEAIDHIEKKPLKDNNDFQKAKTSLGQVRGGLKPKKFSTEFENIASGFGKKFADLRDKFIEANELNKISHFGVVIEDRDEYRYLLLNPMTKEVNEKKEDYSQEEREGAVEAIQSALNAQGDFKAYQVKSLTSKALQKIIANHKTYPDFHQKRTILKGKGKRFTENDDLQELKKALTESVMAKNQKWAEFNWNLKDCESYEDIEKEIDQKGYLLEPKNISLNQIENLIKDNGCLLLPIVNQDITSKNRINKNQFSKDWMTIFANNSNNYRLHPEFNISYRTATPDYPTHKRYGRLQLISHFTCEIIPQQGEYLSHKEQLALFNDQKKQTEHIDEYNKNVNNNLRNNDYKVIGIDRGIKQLATLCVLDKDGKINNDGFKIYEKQFNSHSKQWEHSIKETRYILDLSNLRVETTNQGEKVLVDQSLTLVKANRNSPNEKGTKENQQKIKLKQLAYIRKLQYALQTNTESTLKLAELDDHELKVESTKIISTYGEGEAYEDLPIQKFKEILQSLKNIFEDKSLITPEQRESAKQQIIQLDHADDLKRGIVANIVGVVSFILEKYNYKAYLSLENLCRAWGYSKDGLNGRYLPSTNQDADVDFKEQQNLMLAGLGTYQFFEVQLLRKLFKVQQGKNILLIPSFRSVGNYEEITKLTTKEKNQYVSKPFGMVHFIDPKNTSQKCPFCDATNKKIFSRTHKNNSLFCNPNKQTDSGKKGCGYKTGSVESDNLNRHHILNGDDNGAYHIALKTVKNLNSQFKQTHGTLPPHQLFK